MLQTYLRLLALQSIKITLSIM